MEPLTYVPVATVDRSSQRVHIRLEERYGDGSVRRTLVDERCQTDQSGAYDRSEDIETTIREAGADRVCKFCVSET